MHAKRQIDLNRKKQKQIEAKQHTEIKIKILEKKIKNQDKILENKKPKSK